MNQSIRVGDVFPNITLLDTSEKTITLYDLTGEQPAVVFFYPKDETPGCTAQVCSFRDQYAQFIEAGAVLVGISSDSVKSHQQFKQKYNLPFPLLSDPDGKARKQVGVPSTLGLLPGRVTYVLDADKKVHCCFNSQLNTEGHIKKALETLAVLRNGS